MNKNMKGALVVVAVAALGWAVWHFTHENAKAYARHIIKLNGSTGSFAALVVMDEGYLKAWSKALAKGNKDFSYKNGTYNTQGGKKIV